MDDSTETRSNDRHSLAGVALFVAFMVAGYYYNLTFVQLGLIDLGTRLVGLSRAAVSAWMAALALLTLVVAVATGVLADRRGWSTTLRTKLRALFLVVCLQVVLTALAPTIRNEAAFGAWIVACSLALGVGFPTSFALAIDLVPVRWRGPVAAAITAIAYVAANAIPLSWSIEAFADLMLLAMVPGALVLGVLASGRVPPVEDLLDRLGDRGPAYTVGRFCRPDPVGTWSLAFWVPVVLMFGVFFVDSLGFLRIIETPALLLESWQSPNYGTRLAIAGAHLVGAVVAGVLYVNFDLRWLFAWVFALFALTHVAYTTDLRVAAAVPALATGTSSPLNPMLYAVAVSVYTTLNFALWPDLATAETIGTHAAIAIGIAGWLATFLSTSLALFFSAVDLPLLTHLNLVNALALLLFVGLAVGIYGTRMRDVARGREGSTA